MAKITPGPLAGQISGRLGSAVFSHNRGGPYVRNGTIPTTVTSDEAVTAKARLAASSQMWKALTEAQRLSWRLFAEQNTVLDRLGHQITLSGSSMYNRFFIRLINAGAAPLSLPPVGDPPLPLMQLSVTAEAATPEIEFTFATSPLGASERFQVWGCLLESDGVSYVKNRLRLVGHSGHDQTSPYIATAFFSARFGEIQESQTLHTQLVVLDSATGLVSEPMPASTLVVAGGP